MNNVQITNELSIGPRYVFFNNLAQSQRPMYQKIYYQAMSYYNSAFDLLEVDDMGESEQRITAYIDIIKSAAEQAKNNEIKFFKVMQQRIKDLNKDGVLPSYMEDLDTFLAKYEDNKSTFDYKEFLQILQHIMLQHNTFVETMLSKYNDNMREVKKVFLASEPELRQRIINAAIKKGNPASALSAARKKLDSIAATADKQGTQTITIQKLLTEIYATAIQRTIGAINRDKKLKDSFAAAIKEKNDNPEEISRYIAAYIIKYVLSSDELSDLLRSPKTDQKIGAFGRRLADNVLSYIQDEKTELTEKEIEGLCSAFIQKKIRSLDYKILTGGRDIGSTFKNLTLEDKEALLKRWKIDATSEDRKKLLDKNTTINVITRILKQKVGDYYKDLQENAVTDTEKTIKEAIAQYSAATQGNDKKQIAEARKILAAVFEEYDIKLPIDLVNSKIQQDAVSELLISNSDKILSDALRTGKYVARCRVGTIQIKTDDLINACTKAFMEQFNSDDRDQIFDILNRAFTSFPETYKRNSDKGRIDVGVAAEQYLATQRAAIKELNDMGVATEGALEKFSDFISTSISVKSYRSPADKVGFHAGALGGSVTKTIENIVKMYDLGGISNIDKDLLIFAAYNCADNLIGGVGLATDLETFLLGGAALMSFDEGFVLLEKFLKDHATELIGTKMLLYNLNGIFIPASYVLESVYESLKNFYDYEKIENKIQQTSKVTIINNLNINQIPTSVKVDKKGVKHGTKFNTAQSRWDEMANKADKNVKIEMQFMAGLLDIHNELIQAFTIQNNY